MYQLDLDRVYVIDRVESDIRAVSRMNSMLGGMGLSATDVVNTTDADIPEIIAANGWQHARSRQGRIKEPKPLSIVFNSFKFDGDGAAKAREID